jgi:hypothetical protein
MGAPCCAAGATAVEATQAVVARIVAAAMFAADGRADNVTTLTFPREGADSAARGRKRTKATLNPLCIVARHFASKAVHTRL